MKNHFRKPVLTTFVLLLIVLMTGCAAKGPAFTKVENIAQDKGLVYIYRLPNFAGSAISYDIHVDETPIVSLKNGGYFPYMTDTGEVELWAKTEAKSAVTLDVEAGQTYYVKGELSVGFLMGRPRLSVIPDETAKAEIGQCVLLPGK